MSTTHFGFKTVDERDKAAHVRGVFDAVASRYDIMNDLMSAGLHRAYLVDPSSINLAQRRGPSTIMACELCAGAAATEALKHQAGMTVISLQEMHAQLA